MKIAVIDDDSVFTLKIQQILKSICEKICINADISIYNDERIFIEHISEYDLILLDIEMPEINGLDICNRINNERKGDSPYVIFISSRDHLVFEALKLLPFSFIRKCDIELDLEARVEAIYNKIKIAKAVYKIKDGYTDINIKISNIIYLEKSRNYVLFYTVDDIYKERNLISVKEEELADFGFVRINVGSIVNLRHIISFLNDEITLTNGKKLRVSKPYKSDVRKKFHNWWS